MKQNFTKLASMNNSGFGCLLTLILGGVLLTSIGLGWIVNGFLIFIAILAVLPVISVWGLRWWLKRNLVEAPCPVCQYEFTGFKTSECRCPNCGEVLQVEGNQFKRVTLPGTIDVDAVEVSVKQIEGD
ncbi:MAG: hypothetical protein AB4041_09630 [Microcystaceae cyanobacterium]